MKKHQKIIGLLSIALAAALLLLAVPFVKGMIPEPFDPHLGEEQIRSSETREQIYNRQESYHSLIVMAMDF